MADFTKVGEYLDGLYAKYGLNSSDVIVKKGHEVLYRKMSGWRDVARTEELRGNERYFLYSCTKISTCTAAMQLIEQGKLSLDDKVGDYIPEFATMTVKTENGEEYTAKTPMTIKHLMTMTGGLDYNLEFEGLRKVKEANENAGTLDYVRALGDYKLHFEPGTHYMYSLCHDVLAGVIEVVSSMKFGDYLKKNVFEPLDMNETGFFYNPDEEHLYAQSLIAEPDGTRRTKKTGAFPFTISGNYESGGAGLWSTTEDYSKLAEALANGGVGGTGKRILKPETIKLMHTDMLPEGVKEECMKYDLGYSYGLGVRTLITKDKGAKSPLGEFGWDGAEGSYILMDDINNISIMYTTQISSNHDFLYQTVHQDIRNMVYEILGLD